MTFRTSSHFSCFYPFCLTLGRYTLEGINNSNSVPSTNLLHISSTVIASEEVQFPVIESRTKIQATYVACILALKFNKNRLTLKIKTCA